MKHDDPTILTSMRRTGKEIAAIFKGQFDDAAAHKLSCMLLALMADSQHEENKGPVRMMLLGALAALGREEV